MKKIQIYLIFSLSVSLSLFSQDLRDRIGVCTSINNAAIIKQAGCTYVEIGINNFLMPEKDDTAFAANLKSASESVLPALAANSFFPGDLKLVGPDADPERAIRFAEIAMQRAKQIGTKTFVLGSGGARRIPDGFDSEKATGQFIDLCKQIALLGAKYDVVVVIEPLRKQETNFINTVRQGTAIARAVNHPNLCVLADFYHMLCEDEDAQAIVEAGNLLHHCHIAEKAERTAPGVKGDDFTSYFKALQDINYQGRISIECGWKNFNEEVAPAVAEMKRQISSMIN
ncbi:MAG: sugar phosphate isomerase/epimerase [Tannerella sp.]|jgi:sugar phosphate isomerase/epimerase|nr:sugar phosphate isomerase/epimerase [Tannerella sp.]